MNQLIDAAIKTSRDHNEVVTVTRSEILQAGLDVEHVNRELFEACEGDVVDAERNRHEYWGHGTDGADDSPWRVHVPAE